MEEKIIITGRHDKMIPEQEAILKHFTNSKAADENEDTPTNQALKKLFSKVKESDF